MNHDLEFFAAFLEDPSAPDIADFYLMIKLWGEYLHTHKADFNYLEDDDWKEIRERLIEEYGKRESIRRAIEDEWDELCEIGENNDHFSDDELIKFGRRRLEFLKTHQRLYRFPDEEIAQFEKTMSSFEESVEQEKIAGEKSRLAKMQLDESIANLDDTLADIYERTGKRIILPLHREKKNHKGN